MTQEIELKLTLASEAVEALRSDTLLEQLSEQQGSPVCEQLDNQYFDTPDLLLNQNHAALRIRKTPNHYVQTLKNKGQAIAGLHQRGEWESPLQVLEGQQPHVNWMALPEEARPDESIRDQIKPLFKTDFQRTAWQISFQESHIELVLDEGQISRNKQRTALCEIELELKKGNAEDLFDLALQLAARYPLVPCDINKAERGYQLVNPKISFFQPYMSQLADVKVSSLLEDALSRISRRWDNFVETRNWWLLVIIQRQVSAVLAIMNHQTAIDHSLKASWQSLYDEFNIIIQGAQLPIGLFVDSNNNSRGLSQRILQKLDGDLETRLKNLVTDNRLGQAMLQLGRWLFSNQQGQLNESALRDQLESNLSSIQQLDPNLLDEQLESLPLLQTQAYLYARLQHPLYSQLNAYIDQLLIVAGMRQAEQLLSSLQDGDSRAKLASWTRRLTVELRALQDFHKPLLETL